MEVGAEVELPGALAERVEQAALHTLAAEEAPPVELSIALVSDETIARLHAEYLDKEGVTDVISFPLEQPGGRLVGDVYIGYAQAQRQAGEAGVGAEEEVLRLVVHGTLHVLGWDHPEAEAERAGSEMYLRQEELLASFLAAPQA